VVRLYAIDELNCLFHLFSPAHVTLNGYSKRTFQELSKIRTYVSGNSPSCKISTNSKFFIRVGRRFSSEEKRLDAHATITHGRPLKADLSRAVGQQGVEP
jgi:hypothetical protein